jgi:hypothetical protein
MSYEGDGGEVSAIYRPTADVPALVSPTGSMTFVAPGSVTKGQFGLFRRDMEARAGGPDPHFHRTFSESFYILYGTVALYGGVHAFSNPSDEPAAMLILFSPGAPGERYFEALAEIGQSGRKLSAQEWTELYAEHDQYMVEPAGGTP